MQSKTPTIETTIEDHILNVETSQYSLADHILETHPSELTISEIKERSENRSIDDIPEFVPASRQAAAFERSELDTWSCVLDEKPYYPAGLNVDAPEFISRLSADAPVFRPKQPQAVTQFIQHEQFTHEPSHDDLNDFVVVHHSDVAEYVEPEQIINDQSTKKSLKEKKKKDVKTKPVREITKPFVEEDVSQSSYVFEPITENVWIKPIDGKTYAEILLGDGLEETNLTHSHIPLEIEPQDNTESVRIDPKKSKKTNKVKTVTNETLEVTSVQTLPVQLPEPVVFYSKRNQNFKEDQGKENYCRID